MEINAMSKDEKQRACTVCGGTCVNKANIQDLNKSKENGGIQYQPIECQHCKGTGKEPE
jgi:uncharacterized cysteine cluster protein YcgN (CxxCxxCC family)